MLSALRKRCGLVLYCSDESAVVCWSATAPTAFPTANFSKNFDVPSMRSIDTTLPLSSTTTMAACPFSDRTCATAASMMVLTSSNEREVATSTRGRGAGAVADGAGFSCAVAADITMTAAISIWMIEIKNSFRLIIFFPPMSISRNSIRLERVHDRRHTGRAPALDDAASGQIDAAPDNCGAERVARQRHRRKLCPGVVGRVVSLDLVESTHGWILRVAFSAEYVQAVVHDSGGAAGAAGGHRRSLGPCAGCGIVLFKILQHVVGPVPSGDRVDAPANRASYQVVTPVTHGGKNLPLVGFGIVDGEIRDRLVRLRRSGCATSLAAHRVDQPVRHDDCQGAPLGRQRCPALPAIGCRIILLHRVGCDALAEGAVESADDVDLAVHRGDAQVLQPLRDRRSLPPLLTFRVVDLHESAWNIVRAVAADEINRVT